MSTQQPEPVGPLIQAFLNELKAANTKPATLTPDDLAYELKLNPKTVEEMLRTGTFHPYAFKAGRYWRISRHDFEKWLEEQHTTTTVDPYRLPPRSTRSQARLNQSARKTA